MYKHITYVYIVYLFPDLHSYYVDASFISKRWSLLWNVKRNKGFYNILPQDVRIFCCLSSVWCLSPPSQYIMQQRKHRKLTFNLKFSFALIYANHSENNSRRSSIQTHSSMYHSSSGERVQQGACVCVRVFVCMCVRTHV